MMVPPSAPQKSHVCKRNGSVKLERNPTYRYKATNDQRAGGCCNTCVSSWHCPGPTLGGRSLPRTGLRCSAPSLPSVASPGASHSHPQERMPCHPLCMPSPHPEHSLAPRTARSCQGWVCRCAPGCAGALSDVLQGTGCRGAGAARRALEVNGGCPSLPLLG